MIHKYVLIALISLYTTLISNSLFRVNLSPESVRLSGYVEKNNVSLELYGPEHFKKIIAVKDGKFSEILNVPRGYYILSNHEIYIDQGFDLKIKLTDSLTSFEGKGSLENKVLQELELVKQRYAHFDARNENKKINDTSPAEFLLSISKYQEFAIKCLTRNLSQYFRKTQTDNIKILSKYFYKYYDENYGVDPHKQAEYLNLADKRRKGFANVSPLDLLKKSREVRIKSMTLDEHSRLLSLIWDDFDMNNGELYKFSLSYQKLIDRKLMLLTKGKKKQYQDNMHDLEVKMELVEKNISDEYIKEQILFNATTLLLKYRPENYVNVYQNYLKKSADSLNLKSIQKAYKGILNSKEVKVLRDFGVLSIDGSPLKLSSFKDYYVYIDVWATWCAPCISELPHLKNMYQKYSKYNIKFVGISVDKLMDRAKWKSFVLSNSIPGVQGIVSQDSQFINTFEIRSVPRYLLIDPKGIVMMDNAPRPSSAKLDSIFSKLFASEN